MMKNHAFRGQRTTVRSNGAQRHRQEGAETAERYRNEGIEGQVGGKETGGDAEEPRAIEAQWQSSQE